MSIYHKEKPEYLTACLNSVLNQSALPDEIVMVKDGPLTPELESVLTEYAEKNPGLFNFVVLEKNVGLGLALREGMLHCKNELVARMDTDDINKPGRFEKQLKEFEADGELDVCGTQMAEFEDVPDNVVAHRVVPLDDESIKKYQKKRDGFNHGTVMFKKSAVLRAGNYQSCMLMEDTLLWVNMIQSGAKLKNIDEELYLFRLGKDMYERRGGFAYYKKYKAGRKKIRQTGYISWWDYRWSLFVQFVVAMMPNKLRGWVFKKVLHR